MARATRTRVDKVRVQRARSRNEHSTALDLAYILGGNTFTKPAQTSDAVWVVYNEQNEIIAAAGARMLGREAHLTFCVVTRPYRSRGIQQRLVIARLNWANRQKATAVYTYAYRHNLASITSLVKLGFSPYRVSRDQEFVYLGRWTSKPVKRCR